MDLTQDLSCSLIKWNLYTSKKSSPHPPFYPILFPPTEWTISDVHVSNLNWRLSFPCHNIHVYSTSNICLDKKKRDWEIVSKGKNCFNFSIVVLKVTVYSSAPRGSIFEGIGQAKKYTLSFQGPIWRFPRVENSIGSVIKEILNYRQKTLLLFVNNRI